MTGRWGVEAYVKAFVQLPVIFTAAEFDSFGYDLALSADGTALVAGAASEGAGDSPATPPASGRRADDNSHPRAGAVYLY